MSKGLRYTLEREKIRDYIKLSAEEKLTWLEEVAEFLNEAMPEKARRVMRHFREWKP